MMEAIMSRPSRRGAHLYLVSYDVSCPRRWRYVVKAVRKIGERGQLSVFLCRATPARISRLERQLKTIMNEAEDRLLILDLGPANAPGGILKVINPMTDIAELSTLIV